ncbi:Transcription elongation factor spt6 [Tulasnella sp. 331]|nr:Transcription elongation factor spt6 [Tulasnella sp. 331]
MDEDDLITAASGTIAATHGEDEPMAVDDVGESGEVDVEASAPGSDEGEGDVIAPGADNDDSSEEEEENEEEMRKVAQGFIVDEDEDEEGDDSDEAEKRRRRKKKRRKHRHHEEEDLDEDDLDLMEENMGIRSSRHKFTRLRRGRAESDSVSPGPEPTRRGRMSEDQDDTNELNRIFDDDRMAPDEMDLDDYDDFIEDDEGEEGEMNEEERKERRRAEKAKRRAFGVRPDMAGIDPAAWDEIFDVFGDGRDYEWALEGEDGEDVEDPVKPEMKYTDVFEPSEIKARHLTEDDDIIRMNDLPERMQLSTSSLSPSASLSLHDENEFEKHLTDASQWVATRISPRITRDFYRPNAIHKDLLVPLITAISGALQLLLVKNFEVPYIHTHRRDLISHFNAEKRTRTELLSRDELWRVGTLGMKFRALMERKLALGRTYEKMNVHDEYFEQDIQDKMDSIEAVADVTEWLGMKYRQAQKDAMETTVDVDGVEAKKFKKPTRVSAYDIARQTVTSKLADDFGNPTHKVVQNFMMNKKLHPSQDQDIPPLAYAEQFITAAPGSAKTAEGQLETARMILATELGKDPLLRIEIRKVFQANAVASVVPTEKGLEKIDEFHPYNNFKFLKEKPITKMVDVPQFLYIMQAEHELLVNIHIRLPEGVQGNFQKQLYEAFASDVYNDTGSAWNLERKGIVDDAMEKYLLPAGAKWTREWLREEVEDFLAKKAGDSLQDRINRAPYKTFDIEQGDTPSVLALSWGKGDPQKDAVHAVVLDEEGRLRDHIKLDNLIDEELKERFTELVKRRNPDVIVVGGFTVHTKKLMDQVKQLLGQGDTDGVPMGDQKPQGGARPDHGGNSSRANGESSSQAAAPGGWAAAPATSGWSGAADSFGGWDQAAGSSGAPAADGWGVATVTSGRGDASADGAAASSGWGSNGWGEAAGTSQQDQPRATTASPERPRSSGGKGKEKEKERTTPIIYVNDEVARIYQHSKRGEEEYGRLPVIARYCVGLARFVQSPLTEYAALGADLTVITFDEAQTLIPRDKLLVALERALVNVVNTVGVDVNRAVVDTYYQNLLPFVSGLGPRKAQATVQRISAMGGTLVNRFQLVHENILGATVFLNASGFLRINRDTNYNKSSKKRNRNKDSADALPDPLDDTRIHPEDYHLAKQMTLDALEMDADDVDDEAHTAQMIAKLMDDPENAKKLDVLNLDEFAVSLANTTGDNKRHTLGMIKDELIKPFGELRKEFALPDQWEVATLLTGETELTLQRGKIVSVSVLRIKNGFVAAKMDSGIEGIIPAKYLSNDGETPPDQVVQKGQTIAAVIIAVYIQELRVEFSARPMDIAAGDDMTRRVAQDEYYDTSLMIRNKDLADRKKRREVEQSRRIIKHPNFFNLNYKKAEEMLLMQQRGDVVIRPSTKGPDHIAVTWKVDDGVYQHIDVVDPNADLTSQNAGSQLIVDGKYTFSDLDELIVNHVKAMARRVEELLAHEKCQKGSEIEIHVYLDNFIKAQRGTVRSVYAFGLNRQRPGYFNLYFKTNMNSPIQTWPVKVTPNGYELFGTDVPSVPDLCDAFKTRVMGGQVSDASGGRTPFAGGGRTPGITPGRATPSHASARHTPAAGGHSSSRLVNPALMSKTPNPYAISSAKTPNPYALGGASVRQPPVPPVGANGGGWGAGANGGQSTAGGWGGAAAAGWGTPAAGAPSGAAKTPVPPAGQKVQGPPGMHPSRMAMIQGQSGAGPGVGGGGGSSGGWGGASSGGWGS